MGALMHSTVAIRAAITVAAIILVLIVSRAIRRFRARGLRKMWSILFGRHDPESRGQVPVFRVVALGLAGSGKTVFFASMFHALSVPRLGRSYFLETDVRQRVALGPPEPFGCVGGFGEDVTGRLVFSEQHLSGAVDQKRPRVPGVIGREVR